jgi:hypothetical protein
MPEKWDEQKIKRETERYWDMLQRNYDRTMPVWRRYAQDLLPQEMAWMRAEQLPPESCQTLVLLVGQSIEPLLQSVWAHHPQELLLILNQWYDEDTSGEDFAKDLRELLSLLPPEQRVPAENIHQQVVKPEPAEVFRALVDRVRDRKDVVIDITGAKKSMVAGAFLYAAYGDVPVSYVDFDETSYSPEYSRPYGYASHIRSFDNPYTAFALRDWERVGRLYRSYHFREARRLLEEEIIPVMDGTSSGSDQCYFEDEHIAATQKMIDVLRCYELWDSGDFREAKRKARLLHDQEGLDFQPPTAVEILGDVWPYAESDAQDAQEAATSLLDQHRRLTTGQGVPADSVFGHTDWMVAYAEDELARIERLIEYNEDYRSALLRAASLNEMLLKARWAHLWQQGKVVTPQGASPLPFERFAEQATARKMLNVLTGQWSELRFREGKVAFANGAPTLDSFWEGCSLDMETLIDLRNKTIHTYLSVPYEVAKEATALADRNLEDYCNHWVTGLLPDVVVRALVWPELCRLCGTDAFLSPNLLD